MSEKVRVPQVALGGSLRADTGTPIGAQGALKAQTGHSATIDQLNQKVKNALSSQDVNKFRDFATSVSKDSRTLSSIFSDAREASEHSKRIAETTTRAERAEANLRTEEAYAERISSMFSRGETISVDVAKDPNHSAFFTELLHSQNLGSGAMLRRLESYLGNEALTPIRVAPGNLPSSFDDVHSRHATDSAQVPGGDTHPAGHEGDAKDHGHHIKPVRDKPQQFAAQNDMADKQLKAQQRDLQTSTEHIKKEVNREITNFDQANGIEVGADGQPRAAKGKSLIGKVYKNMESSRDPISDTVNDAIKSLANKFKRKPEKK